MRVRAPSSGSFASARLTRQITCHPIYTSLLPPSSHGFNFRRAFHPSRNITTVNPIGPPRVSPAVSWYCPRLRLIRRRSAPANANRQGQTRFLLQPGRDRSFRPGIGRFDPRSALRAQTQIAGETKRKLVFVGAFWILTDGDVRVAGELPRQCPRCWRAHFDPRPALRARTRLFGEGRQWDHAADRCPIGSVLADQTGRDVCVADEFLPGGYLR
jgi:hypothetical protein